MDTEKIGGVNCPACGTMLPQGDYNESIDQCFRCAMVAELITELIRKQVHAGSNFYR